MAQRYETSAARSSRSTRRLAASDGFTLIELLASIVVLTIGLLSLTTVLTTTNSQSNTAEAQQTEIHVAQKEIERIEQMRFSDVVLSATGSPSHNANTNNPDSAVSGSGCSAAFNWDATDSSKTGTEVVQGCSDPNGIGTNPVLSSTQPIAHQQSLGGRYGMTMYDYVTWLSDHSCLTAAVPILNCPKYKQVTVAVTNNTGKFPKKPIMISTIINDPRATLVGTILNGNQNPFDNPTITCTDGSGNTVPCTNSIGNLTPNTWYLTDSPESGNYTAPTANHTTHYTVAPSSQTFCSLTVPLLGSLITSGCPVPDLLNTSAPPSSITQEYNFSSEQTGTYSGGRVLNPDVTCGGTPTSTDPSKGELWATKPLASGLTLTGNGGMTINTQTVNAAAASVTLCVSVYDLSPNNLLDSLLYTPTALGTVSYTLAQWPSASTPTPVSFNFNFLGSGTHAIPVGDSIGVRVWVSGASGAVPIAIQYDAPSVASSLELDSQ